MEETLGGEFAPDSMDSMTDVLGGEASQEERKRGLTCSMLPGDAAAVGVFRSPRRGRGRRRWLLTGPLFQGVHPLEGEQKGARPWGRSLLGGAWHAFSMLSSCF